MFRNFYFNETDKQKIIFYFSLIHNLSEWLDIDQIILLSGGGGGGKLYN
jgi:hypothetical protein